MNWIKNNIVGLLMAALVMASSFTTLYTKAELNERALLMHKEEYDLVVQNVSILSENMQGYAIRTTQLEGQISAFAQSNIRLVTVLDKLDVLYGSLKVQGAITDERLKQLVLKIDKIENRYENSK